MVEKKPVSRVRQIAYRALLIAVLPVIFLGLIDPLEGGMALIIGLAIYLVAFAVGGARPKRYLWIPYVVSLAIGAVVLGAAILIYLQPVEPESFPPLLFAGNIIYSIAVLITLVAAVITAIQELRIPKNPEA